MYYENEHGEIVRVSRPKPLGESIRSLLTEALIYTNGNQRKAAQHLGISERSLGYKLRRYGIPTSHDGKYLAQGKVARKWSPTV